MRPSVHPAPDIPARPDLAILVYDLRASGVVINALRIAEASAAAGLRVELWLISGDGPLRHRVSDKVAVRTIASSSVTERRGLRSVLALPRLVAMLRRHRPRQFLSSGNHVHAFACLAHALAGNAGVRLIGRASNALAAVVPPKRKGLPGAMGRKASIAIERWQYGRMDRIVAVSAELADHLVRHTGARPERIEVIANGVDLAWIRKQALHPVDHPWFSAGEPPVLLAVGRLSRQKNFELLVRAFAELRNKRPARLVVVGAGKAADRAQLARLAADLGVAEDLWIAGFQDNPYRFMARAALFVLPSRWEGASNVLIEALACDVPIVATDCPTGVREVVAAAPSALLVPVDDAAAMAAAMDRSLAVRPPAEARRHHAARFSLATTLAAYVAVFREDLREASGNPAPVAADPVAFPR